MWGGVPAAPERVKEEPSESPVAEDIGASAVVIVDIRANYNVHIIDEGVQRPASSEYSRRSQSLCLNPFKYLRRTRAEGSKQSIYMLGWTPGLPQ